MCCSPNLQYLTLSPYIEIGSLRVLLVKMTYWSRTYPLTGVFMRRRPHVKTYMGHAMAKAEAGVMQRGMPDVVSKPQELRGDQKDFFSAGRRGAEPCRLCDLRLLASVVDLGLRFHGRDVIDREQRWESANDLD